MPEDITPEQAREIRQKIAKETKARTRTKAKKVVKEKARNQANDFKDFVLKQGVIGLAVGLVLGVQIKALVDQIIASFINPTLGLILPGAGSLEKKKFILDIAGDRAEFSYGAFLSVLISFTTVLFLVYFGVKVLRLDRLEKKSD